MKSSANIDKQDPEERFSDALKYLEVMCLGDDPEVGNDDLEEIWKQILGAKHLSTD